MTASIALTAIGPFAAGVVTGIIGLVCVAIQREEANLTLTREATRDPTSGASEMKRAACAERGIPAGWKAAVWSPPQRGGGRVAKMVAGGWRRRCSFAVREEG